jgi:protein-tyrosine phosphatase
VSYTVLFVCTGNVCRSPAAERLLRGAVKGQDVRVASAGTGALVGEPISPPMADLLRAHGVDPDEFAARQLTVPILRAADIVITMTHAQRAEVVTLLPAAVQRTFVLGELATMLRQVDDAAITQRTGPEPTLADRLSTAFTLAKHHVAPGNDLGGDVDDPYGRSKQVYARSFDQILDGLGPLQRLATIS